MSVRGIGLKTVIHHTLQEIKQVNKWKDYDADRPLARFKSANTGISALMTMMKKSKVKTNEEVQKEFEKIDFQPKYFRTKQKELNEVCKAFFNTVDADQSGEVSVVEFMTALRIIGNCLGQTFNYPSPMSLFAKIDIDKNGTVDLDEVIAAVFLHGDVMFIKICYAVQICKHYSAAGFKKMQNSEVASQEFKNEQQEFLVANEATALSTRRRQSVESDQYQTHVSETSKIIQEYKALTDEIAKTKEENQCLLRRASSATASLETLQKQFAEMKEESMLAQKEVKTTRRNSLVHELEYKQHDDDQDKIIKDRNARHRADELKIKKLKRQISVERIEHSNMLINKDKEMKTKILKMKQKNAHIRNEAAGARKVARRSSLLQAGSTINVARRNSLLKGGLNIGGDEGKGSGMGLGVGGIVLDHEEQIIEISQKLAVSKAFQKLAVEEADKHKELNQELQDQVVELQGEVDTMTNELELEQSQERKSTSVRIMQRLIHQQKITIEDLNTKNYQQKITIDEFNKSGKIVTIGSASNKNSQSDDQLTSQNKKMLSKIERLQNKIGKVKIFLMKTVADCTCFFMIKHFNIFFILFLFYFFIYLFSLKRCIKVKQMHFVL